MIRLSKFSQRRGWGWKGGFLFWMVKYVFFLWLPRSSLTTQTRFSNLTIPLRVLGLASKSIHFHFGLSADVLIKNFRSLSLLAVLDASTAISEDLNLKFSWSNMPPDPPSFLTLMRSHYPST